MRAGLVLPGDAEWPNGDLLAATPDGPVTRLYYEAYDPQVDVAFLKQLRDWDYEAGLDIDPRWWEYTKTPEWIAQEMQRRRAALAKVLINGAWKQAPCPVMFDLERHDATWVLRCLREWRRLLPGVNVVWTLESMQAGWFTQDLIEFLNGYPQCRVLVQTYGGNMTPIAGDVAARDMTEVGVLEERIGAFYGLRDERRKPVRIPSWWDGCLYIENWATLAAAL